MSWRYTGAAWKSTGLTPAMKLVILRLSDAANDDGICWPSHRLVAQDTGLDQRTIGKAIAALEELGLLQRRQQVNPNGGSAVTRYTLTTVTPPGATPPPPGLRPPPPRPYAAPIPLNRQLNRHLIRSHRLLTRGWRIHQWAKARSKLRSWKP